MQVSDVSNAPCTQISVALFMSEKFRREVLETELAYFDAYAFVSIKSKEFSGKIERNDRSTFKNLAGRSRGKKYETESEAHEQE